MSLHFDNVSFAYDGMAGNLLENVNAYLYAPLSQIFRDKGVKRVNY